MKPVECRFEDDVLMYVATERWPDRVPVELKEHAATCPVCGDLAVVARAMDAERGEEVPSARVPSAGTVWWHAQLRARQEAVKTVGRPITVAHAVLLAVCGGAAGAVFGATTGWFQRALHIVGDSARSVAANVHMPQLPSFQVDATTFVATYATSLGIVAVTLAVAAGVMFWAFREG